MRLGRADVEPRMPRLLPDRADRRRERRIGERADRDAHQPGVPGRAPVQRRSARRTEVSDELVAGIRRADERLRFARDDDPILGIVRADAEHGARAALTGETVARDHAARLTSCLDRHPAAPALRRSFHEDLRLGSRQHSAPLGSTSGVVRERGSLPSRSRPERQRARPAPGSTIAAFGRNLREEGCSMRRADGQADTASPAEAASLWQQALDQLREWDPKWAETCLKMTTNPWTTGVLSRKTIELISVALNAAPGAINPEGARRHIRAALAAGASRDEILTVLKMASMMSVYSCSVGGSILVEELPPSDLGTTRERQPTPTYDRVRAAGRWNPLWDTFFYLDPVWTDELVASGLGIAADSALSPTLVELLSIALHVSHAHLH